MRELAADHHALRKQGTTTPLATALYCLATLPTSPVTSVAAASILEPGAGLNVRLDALLGDPNPYPLRLPRPHLVHSLMTFGVVSLLLILSYVAHEGKMLITLAHWLQGYC